MKAKPPSELLLVAVVLIIVLLVLLWAPDSKADQIYNRLESNFISVHQSPRTDKLRFWTGEQRFRGDCDDYAVAAYYQLWKRGEDPRIYVIDRDGPHVIACAEVCYDSERRPYLFTELKEEVTHAGVLPDAFIAEHF